METLETLDENIEKLTTETNINEQKNNETNNENKISVLERYGEDLTKKEYITNPSIGRDKEINEMILALITPDKAALLTGKPGIGKTALVEGLAYRIQKGDVPNALKGWSIIKINITSLLGSTTENGNTDARLEILLNELKTKTNTILFIDEVHLLVNKNPNNNIDFANMLKPFLDRGTIKMIGATTTEEYEAYILRDRAFLRRFIKIDIAESDPETVVKILMGTYPKLEKQSGVTIPYSEYTKEKIFRFMVEYTDEYKRIYEIGNRYPDIALALLGNAFSNAVFENKNTLNIKNVYDAIKNTKSVYDDAKRKGLVEFKNEFKDIIKEENVVLD